MVGNRAFGTKDKSVKLLLIMQQQQSFIDIQNEGNKGSVITEGYR